MNLQGFLNHRNICPICDEQLSFVFHSKKRQKIRYFEDRILITFPMDSIKKNEKSYQVGFSFKPTDNTFFIDFFTREGAKFDSIPTSLIEKFRSFNTNLGAYNFFKYCSSCMGYSYRSNYFELDLKNSLVDDISIHSENFMLTREKNDEYRIYNLINNYNSNTSILQYGKQKEYPDFHINKFPNGNIIETSLIKFVSKEETLNRLNKLLVFS